MVFRSGTTGEREDAKVILILVTITLDSRHTYLELSEDFRIGSLGIQHAITEIQRKVSEVLPEVIADFLSRCKAKLMTG
jgi:hypothetical protein